jgi:hypothetical protein
VGHVAFYEAHNSVGHRSVISYNNLSMSSIFESGWGALGGGYCSGGQYINAASFGAPHRQRLHGPNWNNL